MAASQNQPRSASRPLSTPVFHSALLLRAPYPAGTDTSKSHSHMLVTGVLFSPNAFFFLIYRKIQILSLHFHKFWQICLTLNKAWDILIIPESSLQLLFSLNFPPRNNHYSDFSYHKFLFAVLDLHVNGIIQYVVFLCLASFTQHLIFEIFLDGLCISSSFLYVVV